MDEFNIIPIMDDPLSVAWQQPRDIRSMPMDEKIILLRPDQLEELPEYSYTIPSGVYPGKCWKREEMKMRGFRWAPSGRWWLGWYGIHSDPKRCTINWRIIEVVK
jgi:hypothetical protein